MAAPISNACWSRGGSPVETTVLAVGSEGGTSSHTSTPTVTPGGAVPGHAETRRGQVLEHGRKGAVPLSPAPQAMAVPRVGVGMGLGAEENPPFQGSPLTSPHPPPRLPFGVLHSGEKCMARSLVLESGSPGLPPWLFTFLAVCLWASYLPSLNFCFLTYKNELFRRKTRSCHLGSLTGGANKW